LTRKIVEASKDWLEVGFSLAWMELFSSMDFVRTNFQPKMDKASIVVVNVVVERPLQQAPGS
jgi:hypothetical protein